MPLAGIIIGNDDSHVTSMLPIGDQTVLEFQARIAHAAGAGHIVVMVSKLPAEMVAVFDRLRASGINVDVARDPHDAADRIHPDERLLVMADGVVADRYIVAELATAKLPTLITFANTPGSADFERIDATDRWSGLAILDGKLLRETVAMLGDWTLSPTLLRAALQAGAVRQRLADHAVIGRATDSGAAHALAAQMAKCAPTSAAGTLSKHFADPIAAKLAPIVLNYRIPLQFLAAFPLVLAVAALILAVLGWFAGGYSLLVLAMVPAALAHKIAEMSARRAVPLSIYDGSKELIFCAGLLLLGYHEYRLGQGWGAIIAGLWAVTLLLRRRTISRSLLHIEVAMIVMLVAVLVGVPLWGLGIVILALVASDEIVARTFN